MTFQPGLPPMTIGSRQRSTRVRKCHEREYHYSSFKCVMSFVPVQGGDDCRFKGWDTRALDRPIFVNKWVLARFCDCISPRVQMHLVGWRWPTSHSLPPAGGTRWVCAACSLTHSGSTVSSPAATTRQSECGTRDRCGARSAR